MWITRVQFCSQTHLFNKSAIANEFCVNFFYSIMRYKCNIFLKCLKEICKIKYFIISKIIVVVNSVLKSSLSQRIKNDLSSSRSKARSRGGDLRTCAKVGWLGRLWATWMTNHESRATSPIGFGLSFVLFYEIKRNPNEKEVARVKEKVGLGWSDLGCFSKKKGNASEKKRRWGEREREESERAHVEEREKEKERWWTHAFCFFTLTFVYCNLLII